MPPKVSVIMPVYNGEKYLNEAIESILYQSYSDFEFIIIDDHSTDDSVSIINAYKDPRIIFTCNDQNIGVTRSLNLGLSLAKGEYIARMDADDISLPERFKNQVSYLDAHPDVGVLGTSVCLINQSGKIGEQIRFPESHILLRWRLCFFENPIIHPSVMMRRQLVNMFNGYDPKMHTSQDHLLWCRLSGVTHLANLPDIYLYLRKHQKNISSSKWGEQRRMGLENSRELLSEILGENVPLAQLEGACQAVWAPADANSQDYFQLALLKYRLCNVILSDAKLTELEKTKMAQDVLNELKELSGHIHGIIAQTELERFIHEMNVFIFQSSSGVLNPLEQDMSRLISLQCPKHHIPLSRNGDDNYQCEQGCSYPIINGIPRFVSSNNYAMAFGAQWKNYQKTQLDSYTGKPISFERLKRLVGGDLSIVAGRLVLEAGCGAGRFTEILLQSGARVVATDLSEAVEANFDNCHNNNNYVVFQANLLQLPVEPNQFDVVVCIGVIQHTPNPEETIKALCGYVKPGGMLIIDHYSYNYPFTPSRRLVRALLIKTSPVFSIRFCRLLVSLLWPIHRLLWKYSNRFLIGKLRSWFIKWSPVIDYHDSYAFLGPELLFAWAMLDTHDNLTDYYKHLRSKDEIATTLALSGMEKIETADAGNGVEARAFKPALGE